jgi:hypothetical protein
MILVSNFIVKLFVFFNSLIQNIAILKIIHLKRIKINEDNLTILIFIITI